MESLPHQLTQKLGKGHTPKTSTMALAVRWVSSPNRQELAETMPHSNSALVMMLERRQCYLQIKRS
jgi:hypothetical protein